MPDNNGSLDSCCRHSSCITSIVLAALIFLLLTLAVLPTPIRAHAPAVKLEYKAAEQILSVIVTHSVSTPDHYVKKIEVKKNADLYLMEEYTSQPATATFTYDYEVIAGDGDVLEATAYCSLYGSKTERITVAAPSTSPVITPPSPTLIVSTPSPSPVYTPSPTATLTPLPATPPSSATLAPTPGFDTLFALSGLLAAMYMIKRKL